MPTKELIIEQSKILFFEQGIANTRLQQIADASSISVGNLAYHFKNKEAIVQAVYENLFEELAEILSHYIMQTGFNGFDKQFSDLYNFFTKNQFTYNNQWEIERNHPHIQAKWLSINRKVLQQLCQRLNFCLKNELIKPEASKGQYDRLLQNVLIIINNWIPQQILQRKPISENLYKKSLWVLFYPIFTLKGNAEFTKTILLS
ncbi:MAG: TetR/AcrR family transcriptional regulator [Sediminibacterium sp.]